MATLHLAGYHDAGNGGDTMRDYTATEILRQVYSHVCEGYFIAADLPLSPHETGYAIHQLKKVDFIQHVGSRSVPERRGKRGKVWSFTDKAHRCAQREGLV